MTTADHIDVSGGIVYTPSQRLENANICIKDGRIAGVTEAPCGDGEVIDAAGKVVIPGLIDIHTHGALGWDASAGPPGEDHLIELARRGTTSLLPTIYPVASRAERVFVLKSYRELSGNRRPGAEVLGLHMEGPFLNPNLGAQLPEWCESPAIDGFSVYLDEFGELIRVMSLSPELEGSEQLIEALRRRGTVVAVGHSAAGKGVMERSRAAGLSHCTHIFNATARPPLVHEGCVVAPDMNEFCLADRDMTVDVVVDGQSIHMDDIILRLTWMCKGPDRLILISDSMYTAGLSPGRYTGEDGRNLVVDSTDVCVCEDVGICGSTMMMLDTLRNLMARLDLPLEQALPAATSNPARLLGLGDRKGGVAAGMDADLVVLDESMNVYMSLVGGRIVEEYQ